MGTFVGTLGGSRSAGCALDPFHREPESEVEHECDQHVGRRLGVYGIQRLREVRVADAVPDLLPLALGFTFGHAGVQFVVRVTGYKDDTRGGRIFYAAAALVFAVLIVTGVVQGFVSVGVGLAFSAVGGAVVAYVPLRQRRR